MMLGYQEPVRQLDAERYQEEADGTELPPLVAKSWGVDRIGRTELVFWEIIESSISLSLRSIGVKLNYREFKKEKKVCTI
jgi:hypothetical protein